MAENVEGADADKGFHFFGERLNTAEEIGERWKLGAFMFAQNGFLGAESEAFDKENGNADVDCRLWTLDFGPWASVHAKSRPRVIY